MAPFFVILLGLLTINAILIIFSVKGTRERFKKPIRKIKETSIPKLFPHESPETEYKEAV